MTTPPSPAVTTATASPAAATSVAASQTFQPTIISPVSDPLLERFGRLRSALGPGTVIQGKLSFDTPVSIDGKLSGEVFSTKALLVGEQGTIDAALEVAVLVVRGVVRGSVKASEGIEILPGGRLEGDIITPKIRIDEGGAFSGKCAMPNSAQMVAQANGQTTASTQSTSSNTNKTTPSSASSSTGQQKRADEQRPVSTHVTL